jgi:hypothetical protein
MPSGFVAHFASEVVKEQFPLSVGGLGGQGVEQGGRRAALVSLLHPQRSFPDHGHEFATDERGLRRGKPLASSPRTREALDSSLVRLHPMLSILALADGERGPVLRVLVLEGRCLGGTAVKRAGLRAPGPAAGLLAKPAGGLLVPMCGEQKVGSVLKVEMAILDRQSKGKAVNE